MIRWKSICSHYEKFKNVKRSYIFEKALVLSITSCTCKCKNEKIFKEQEPIQILECLGLINETEEYQKIYNHVWKKQKSRV